MSGAGTGWVADISFAWPTLTGRLLRGLGAVGVIGYTGCDDARKNVGIERVADWRSAGLAVGLVVENSPDGLAGGADVGAAWGRSVMAGARSVGYPTADCALFASADFRTDAHSIELVAAAMKAFARVVPVPGLYGSSYVLDRCADDCTFYVGWQSDSTAWSNGLSGHANLAQRYADPRAHGYALDVSDIIRGPLHLWGDPLPVPADDIDQEDPAMWLIIRQQNGAAWLLCGATVAYGLHVGSDVTALHASGVPVVDVTSDLRGRMLAGRVVHN
jgi:hypothetical protein